MVETKRVEEAPSIEGLDHREEEERSESIEKLISFLLRENDLTT